MDRTDWDNVAKKGRHYLFNPFFGKCKKREIITLIKKWDDTKRKKTVLTTDLFEEAVGSDGILLWLKGRYKRVVGMDISCEMVKRACSDNNLEDGICVVSDIRRVTFKDNCFDLIISNSTIDHFSELDLALRELYRILKPDGILILTLHNKFQFAFSSKIWLKRILNIKDYSYGYVYSLRQIQPRLKKLGFTIDKLTYLYFFPPIMKLLVPKKNQGRIYQICKRLIRVYQDKMSSKPYINKFTGSNIALKLLKK